MDISLENVRYASRSGVKDLLEESKGCLCDGRLRRGKGDRKTEWYCYSAGKALRRQQIWYTFVSWFEIRLPDCRMRGLSPFTHDKRDNAFVRNAVDSGSLSIVSARYQSVEIATVSVESHHQDA